MPSVSNKDPKKFSLPLDEIDAWQDRFVNGTRFHAPEIGFPVMRGSLH